MGKQLNFYRNAELVKELAAEAMAQTAFFKPERPYTPQAILRLAWERRPPSLRRSGEIARLEAKKGARKS